MYKGCQKKILLLKNTGSPIFEEAYFILKKNTEQKLPVSESDMVKEANRIIEENLIAMCGTTPPPKPKKHTAFYFKWFLAGVFSCGTIMTIILSFIK